MPIVQYLFPHRVSEQNVDTERAEIRRDTGQEREGH